MSTKHFEMLIFNASSGYYTFPQCNSLININSAQSYTNQ